MIKHWRATVVVMALMPTVAWAQSPFTGKWKVDLSATQLPSKPVVFLLKDGVFSCKTCVPAYAVKADGMMHPMTGSPYYDHMMVKVVDAHTLEAVRSKKGVATSKLKDVISADGATLTGHYEDLTVPGSPVTGSEVYTRVEAAPPGAHAISGSWREQKLSSLSSNAQITDIRIEDGMMHLSMQSGQSYVAKIGGPPASYTGDPGTTAVAVQAQGPRTMIETDYRDGKVISVNTITVGPDGKTLKVDVEDKLHGTTSHFIATKV